MSNTNDFIIEKGVLKKYVGLGGDVVIPDGVTGIGSKVFASEKNITSVIIPDGVTEIGDRAFYGVPLEKVDIPDSVVKIKQFVFRETNDLFCKPKAIVFAGKVLIRYAGNAEKYKVPDGTVGIGDNAFQRVKLSHVVIPDSILHIGNDAFGSCYNLKKIEISEQTVERIGKNVIKKAFFNLPSKTEKIRELYFPKYLITRILLDDIQLTGLKDAFEKEIRQKNTREDLATFFIKTSAADALSRLLKLQTKLSDDEIAFYMDLAEKSGSIEMKSVILNYRNDNKKPSDKKKEDSVKDANMTVSPAEWKKIFKFSYTPEGVVISGYKGTNDTIEIPAYIGKYPVIAIKEDAFAFTDNIKNVIISDGVLKIGECAFNTSELQHISIPSSVSEFGEDAFFATIVTIHAPENSYAEKYEKENDIPFVAE